MITDASPLNDTTVKIMLDPQVSDEGVDVIYAYINESQPHFCNGDEAMNSCLIGGLEAYTTYTVCVVACHDNSATTIDPSAYSIENSPIPSEANQVSAQSAVEPNDDNFYCSIPACVSVLTRPSGKWLSGC